MRRIAFIADIHGNLAALEAVVEELRREAPDRVICLGDVAVDGPQPTEVMEILHHHGWPSVRGNHDDIPRQRSHSPMQNMQL